MHLWQSPDWRRELAVLRMTGANVVRFDLNWRDTTGQWNQGKKVLTADVMALARDYSMAVIVSLTQDLSQPPPYNGAALQYAQNCAELCRTYSSVICAVEIMNEPNGNGKESPAATPASYIGLLKTVYPTMKTAAPAVRVLGGSTSRADLDYWQQLMNGGGYAFMDGAAVHAYSNSWPVSTNGTAMDGPGIDSVHQITGKPIWVTEWGASTVSPEASSNYSVTEAQQATMIGQGWADLDARRYVAGATLYNTVENGGDSIWGRWGVVHRDWRNKPGYGALRAGILR